MRILALSLLLFVTNCKQHVGAQNNGEIVTGIDKNASALISAFFNDIKSSNYNKALENLLLQNENIDPRDSATLSLREKFVGINQYSGKYVDSKLLKKRFVKDVIGIYTYLVRYEKKFYRFTFIYYDNGTKLRIYKFTFDDVLELELEESLKLYTE
ncbi:MAG: hypothetical protein ACTHLE_12470 [Agriterribacter sp.]